MVLSFAPKKSLKKGMNKRKKRRLAWPGWVYNHQAASRAYTCHAERDTRARARRNKRTEAKQSRTETKHKQRLVLALSPLLQAGPEKEERSWSGYSSSFSSSSSSASSSSRQLWAHSPFLFARPLPVSSSYPAFGSFRFAGSFLQNYADAEFIVLFLHASRIWK